MNWDQIFASRAMRMKASEIRELLKLLDQPDIISFAGGIPDPKLFPSDAYAAAYAQALAGASAGPALQYSVSEGYLPLRQWIAGEMGRLGVACRPDNILVTSGSQQALDYLGKILISPGDTALVTSPTYLGALGAFNAYEPCYDRLDPYDNRAPAEIDRAARDGGGRPKFAYVCADFANPTGETLDRAGRLRLLALAEALDIPVIEDAAYTRLRFEGEHVAPILALEIAEKGDIDACRTVYCGTFSKTLAPGLRVGWICAASELIRKLVLVKQASDLHSPTINQMVTHLVAEAGYDAQVAKVVAAYRSRRDAMLAALDREMPAGVRFTRPEGGMFVWVDLPAGLDGADLLRSAIAEERVAFVPGKAFHADGSGAGTLRLSFSATDEATIAEGIARLGRLIRRHAGA